MFDLILFAAISAGGALALWQMAGAGAGLRFLYRILAFELLLTLALLTRPRWLANPLSAPQLVSWLLWAAGLGLAGLALLQRPARQVPGTAEAPDPGEGHPWPPRSGIYRMVRHPFYAAALFAGWGLFAKSLTPVDNATVLHAFLLTGASLFVVSAARADEMADYLRFGTAYAQYVKSSRMLIPFIL